MKKLVILVMLAINTFAFADQTIFDAAFQGDAAFIKNYQGDINAKDANGRTVFAYAAQSANAANSVVALIDANADVNAKDSDGTTPLMWVIQYQKIDAIKVMINAKADVNARDANGKTALILAAAAGLADVVNALVGAKADVNAVDNDGKTSLVWAFSFNRFDVFKILTGAGADVNAVGTSGDMTGLTPLMWAVRTQNINAVTALTAAGAKVNAKNKDDQSALTFAVLSNNTDIINFLKKNGGVDMTTVYDPIYVFNANMEAAKKIGLDTDRFSNKTGEIVATNQGLHLVFPHNGSIASANVAMTFKADLDDDYIYVANSFRVLTNDAAVTADLKFPTPGKYHIDVSFSSKDGNSALVPYDVTVEKNAAFDELAAMKKDNYPVVPTGYFYLADLSMRRIDQKYLFNTVNGIWTVHIGGQDGKNLRWIVQRPGILFDEKNITTTSSSNTIAYAIKFPEKGVYVVDLYDMNRVKILARYKIRNNTPASGALADKAAAWPDTNPALSLVRWVLDIPFGWEMDINTLAAKLKENAKSDIQLYDMIYAWETQNINYDVFGDNIVNNKENPSEQVPYLQFDGFQTHLLLRNWVCAHYTEVFGYMCAISGLEAYDIAGSPLMNHTTWDAHGWNAIKVSGKWQFIDATWSVYRRAPEDFFPTRVVTSLTQYVPVTDSGAKPQPKTCKQIVINKDGNTLQELFNPLDTAEVEKGPDIQVNNYLHEMGFSVTTFSHKEYRFSSGKSLEMDFPAPSGNVVNTIDTKAIETTKPQNQVKPVVGYQNGAYTTKWEFPESGIYTLNISFETKGKPKMTTTIAYEVTVN